VDALTGIVDSGGPLIWPLLALFVWGLGIIGLKWVTLRRSRIIDPQAVNRIETMLLEGKIEDATAYCKQHPLPMTRIVLAGIVHHDKSEAELKEVLEEAGRQEVPGIRSHLTALGTIASVAPLLGLFGTVLGMISVFSVLSSQNSIDASRLAGGISQALTTTAVGMAIAVPTLAFHNYFITRVQLLILEMEKISLHMVAVLKRL
jgi:biopolymer transport protein ExbB